MDDRSDTIVLCPKCGSPPPSVSGCMADDCPSQEIIDMMCQPPANQPVNNSSTPPVPIPTDAILTITTGNPNDYCVMGVFRAKQEIDYAACYRAYVQEHPNQGTPAGHRLGFKPSEFLGWLARLGLLEAIDCFEWNIEWGCIEGVENHGR